MRCFARQPEIKATEWRVICGSPIYRAIMKIAIARKSGFHKAANSILLAMVGFWKLHLDEVKQVFTSFFEYV